MFGESCLHLALNGSHNATLNDIQDVLTLLLWAGADVYAIDDSDTSVSETACERDKRYRTNKGVTNNQKLWLRVIWVEALTICGYDAEEVISGSLQNRTLSSSHRDESISPSEVDDAKSEVIDKPIDSRDNISKYTEICVNVKDEDQKTPTVPTQEAGDDSIERTSTADANNFQWSFRE